jgi:uncharacterized iron-regulated membrane protein
MSVLRRLIILSHRYLGIAISLMCVIWFASGIVMIYAGGMPRLTELMRLDRAPVLDLAQVTLSPADAARRVGTDDGQAKLISVLERPAYRFQGLRPSTVFADTGEILEDIDVSTARTVASRFLQVPVERVTFERTLDDPDQWTLVNRSGQLHKFRVDDEAGTEIYVSPRTADVAQLTTRNKRALAWMGTIPHWLYFTGLRTNQPLWYRAVVWLSALACILSLLGLVLAFTQFRKTTPFRLSQSIPYRGWMRWHYICGALFGVFVLTWAFSGLLSMEPFDWTNARGLEVDREVMTGGPTQLSSFSVPPASAFAAEALNRPAARNRPLFAGSRAIKEIGFVRIHGDHYYAVATARPAGVPEAPRERLHQPYLVRGLEEPERFLVNAQSMRIRTEGFGTSAILSRLKAAYPDVPITESALLSDYDSYYYSRGRQAPLPVLRVKFSDPMQTWLYINPADSSILSEVHRLSRAERWLYNGLHSLDFAFWYSKRPLWDIGVILLCLGGLATSLFGLYLGVKRLVRDLTPSSRGVSASAGATQE